MWTTSESDVGPVTRAELATDLSGLGLSEGDVVLMHSSFRSLGFVIGGPMMVVHAVLDVIGSAGTVIVPTMTANNCDPQRWARTWRREIPEEWWATVRQHMPGFDPARTQSVGMGAIAEAVRTWPGARRSVHPQTSFAALGPAAQELTGKHALDCHLGPESPLGTLYDIPHSKILLLGVGFGVCTAFHLGEYRWADNGHREYECVTIKDGVDQWYRYRDVILNDSDFGSLGEDFETSGAKIRQGRVGRAESRLFQAVDAVDFAAVWFGANRTVAGSDQP